MRVVMLALLVGVVPALAGSTSEPVALGIDPAVYLEVVSVGCAPPSNGNLVYVWHSELPGIDEVKAMRMFKYLQTPKFEGCLSSIARTKPGLYEALLELRPDTNPDAAIAVLRRARAALIEFGAHWVLAEVANAGALGPESERFFERCAELTDDEGDS